ncbi:MAG: hypothetical protein KJ579_07830 [Verrucomicrobia bacterium]|nr:hypothetical protein [Verrucomicrobiota bacterium]
MGTGWGPEALLGVRSVSPSSPPLRGDVIVYEMGDGVLAHRVIARQRTPEGWRYVTQGDARWQPDQIPVSESCVRGVVVRVWRGNREMRLDGWCGAAQKRMRWVWLRFKTLLARCRGALRSA